MELLIFLNFKGNKEGLTQQKPSQLLQLVDGIVNLFKFQRKQGRFDPVLKPVVQFLVFPQFNKGN